MLLCCLREVDRADIELKRLENARYRIAKATIIQRRFRAYILACRESASGKIQNFIRQSIVRRVLKQIVMEQCSLIRIQKWLCGVYKTRIMASRRIAFTWLNAKQGRLLRHLQIIGRLLKWVLMKKICCQQGKAPLIAKYYQATEF